jgi:peptidoglycan hydrolase CwlO-like protein
MAGAVAKVDAAVEEQWALARSGAALAAPTARVAKVAEELNDVQGSLRATDGADKAVLAGREEALAAELRSLRRTESVSTQISARLSTLCAQLEALVASAGELVASAGTAGDDLDSLGSELASLTGALDEAKRIMATGEADQPKY